jgi:hypothetical protein
MDDYKYKKVPEFEEIFWIKLLREYDGNSYQCFPPDLKVGDITWCKSHWNTDIHFLFEDNKYTGNFDGSFFEIVTDPRDNNNYEIY